MKQLFLILIILLAFNTIINAQSKPKLPFVGKRYFNFMGGNGTGEVIQINSDGSCMIYTDGGPHGNEELIFNGKYSSKILAYRKNASGKLEFVAGYSIIGNKIFLINVKGKIEKGCLGDEKPCQSTLDK